MDRDYNMEECALNAMAAEAKRRKITYGQLMASTTREERKQLIQEYAEKKQKDQKGK